MCSILMCEIILIMCVLLPLGGNESMSKTLAKDRGEMQTCDLNCIQLERIIALVDGRHVFKLSLQHSLPNKTCYQANWTRKLKVNSNVEDHSCKFPSYQNHHFIECNIRYDFANLSNILAGQDVFFKISPLLGSYLISSPVSLLIKFSVTVDSPWAIHSLVNQLVSLTITRNGETLTILPHPIDIFFRYKLKTHLKLVQGSISKSTFKILTDNKDSLVTVFKMNYFEMAGQLTVFIKFHHMKPNEGFKVLLSRNNWPDYNTMTEYSKTISRGDLLYKIKIENHSEEDIYYLGILPKTLGTLAVRPISYSFEVRYFQCFISDDGKRSSQGCRVGGGTTEEMLHCQCNHLSLFGGHVAIPPRNLDLLSDIHLILDIKDNPRTLLLVSSLILVYLIVLVWTRHSDRKDQLQRHVVVLADNFPGERWAYLVTVFTGFWIGAGTDANVGLRLYGTKGMSRVHILQSHKRKVLKQNCDDWFLIFTPKSLGEITKIHLFHDHHGSSHDWQCLKILIYDLKYEQDYKFIIEKWLSLKEVDECVELYAYPTSTVKYLKRTQIIRENIIFGLRETHLLLSIFTRHPRSSVTRSQRLSICLCIVIVHLLTNIMFYQLGEVDDYPYYSAHRRPIIISMESSFVAAPFTFIVIFCFKKSRIITVPKTGENVPLTLTAKMPVPLESGLHVNQSRTGRRSGATSSDTDRTLSSSGISLSSENQEEEGLVSEEESCWEGFYRQVQSLLFQVLLVKPMMPVRIAEEDEQASRIRTKWMFAAWILCLTAIFAGGASIILYNLKMDLKTSDEWMQQSFRYSLANIFLMSPVKIIVFAVILAMLYGQLQYIPSYECDTEAALNKESVGDEVYLSNILRNRRQKCYRPLTNKENMVIRMRSSNWRRWRIVINFIVVMLLYTFLTLEVLFHWEGLYVPTTNHILQMFGEGRNITSFSRYYEYLLTVVLPALNKEFWYNGKSTMPHDIWKQGPGFTEDHMTRLMSRPSLRQQRVLQDSCQVSPEMEGRFSHCYAPLSWSNMEEEEFSVSWSRSHMPAGHVRSPWVPSDSDSPLLICGLKTEQCYLPGGYITKLDYNRTASALTLRDLNQSGWLDEATRVVFLEVVMYNVNTDLMSYAAPMLETLADGSFQFHVKATNLHSRPINYTARLTIILSFTFYYFCRTVLLFNRQGLAYLFSSIGLLDIFLNVFLHVTMISMTLYNEARRAYIYEWHEGIQDDLKMTKDIFVHRAVLRYETAILVIIIPAQVLHNFRFGKQYLIVFKTLTSYLKFVLGLGLVLAAFFLAFTQINIINGVNDAFFTLSRNFGWLSYQSSTKKTYQPLSKAFCFVSNVFAIFTVVVSVMCYIEAKEYFKYDDDFNMIYFLCEKLNRAKTKTSEWKRKLGKRFALRTRAGADDIDMPFTNRTCGQVKQMCSDLCLKCDMVLEKLMDIEQNL